MQNFENQNPANTLWTKQYNLYSKIDTEAPRYLGFERWWGGHVNLNAEEIQFIVDELFIGNKLAAGTHQDLRRHARSTCATSARRSWCSARRATTSRRRSRRSDWILDLYDDVDEIRSHGQTIVYTIHETVGHLGIFVSGGVARKEHGEFSSNIDLIDVLPPGLYEAVFEAKSRDTASPDLVTGDWVMRCEARTLDDIRALGGNDAGRRAPVRDRGARLGDQSRALPHLRAAGGARHDRRRRWPSGCGGCIRCGCNTRCSPTQNPLMASVKTLAEQAREDRKPVAADNPFAGDAGRRSPTQIVASLDAWRDMTETHAPSACSCRSTARRRCRPPSASIRPTRVRCARPERARCIANSCEARIAELKSRIADGGLRECAGRAACSMSAWRAAASTSAGSRPFAACAPSRTTSRD